MKDENRKKNLKFLYFIVVVTTLTYIIWRLFFSIPFELGILSCVFGILLFLSEALGAVETIQQCYGMGEELIPDLPPILDDEYPDVDVFIATYNEPCDLLFKTINGCLYMSYPDKSKVHIYVLDDGNREEVKQLAIDMGVHYITRDEHNDAKAGNLNNAFFQTKSPLIATFDADMIPLSDFLLKTVPYFFLSQYKITDNKWEKKLQEDIKIGFIQSPQAFYNPDLFQYNLFSEGNVPNEQDYFYRDIQLARNKTNSAIYGGSNTVISRKALEDIGGFYTGVITEDFATGISIQSEGYTCYAISDVLALGLAPTDLKSLIKQRERWARGCIQTLKKVKILTRKGLTKGQKMSYISSLLYWYTPVRRFMYILSPILFALFNIQVVKCSLLELLLWWTPQFVVYQYAIKVFSKNIRTNRLSNIYDTILFPSLLPSVLLETFGISKREFVVTKKEKVTNEKSYQIKSGLVHVFLFILSILSLFVCIKEVFVGNANAYIIVLFWVVINMYSLMMTIFFMMGRQYYRNSERFFIETPINVEGIQRPCYTKDLSDTGLSFVCQFPCYIKPDKIINFKLLDVKFTGLIKHVSYQSHQWVYGVEIVNISDLMKQKYFHIIYNREPTLPSAISKEHSFFDELSYNIIRRTSKEIQFNRKIPRLELDKELMSTDNKVVVCKNFNYEYILLVGNGLKSYYEFNLHQDITLKCQREKNYEVQGLYKVIDYEILVGNPIFLGIIEQWAKEYEDVIVKRSIVEIENLEFDEREYL